MVTISITDKPEMPSLNNDCGEFLCLGEACFLIGGDLSPAPEDYLWGAFPLENSGLPDTVAGNVASVSPSVPGLYTYTYAIVSDGCISDSASVDVFVLGEAVVLPDNYLVDVNSNLENFDVLLNDTFDQTQSFTISVISPVDNGTLVNNGDGTFTYTPNSGFIGLDQFVYEFCYDDCSFCDQAVVTLRTAYPGDQCVIPTIITPNGDGVNDILFITCLDEESKYPNNDIIIFNQWGDEVYRAAPYRNEWDGIYKGKDLPDGVYFYIFKTGEVGETPIKGSVTIFR